MLKQLYYTLIYPFINYGLISWGNTYTSHLTKLRTALNKCIRTIFFARSREDASPYHSLLGILKLDNVFKLKIAHITYKILNEPMNRHNELLTPIYIYYSLLTNYSSSL